ncbi:cryptochrome/photolyase family protein [Solirubrobacter sp. CPCC 204708]|uniref:Cryptochrome/photolyase family protein n=1 Tax=Solirubrobacter deserti TaxID=2282478 RepID=A0ABT4RHX8_9ACTN|nr:cryptochrome/photolyase family protein [Solirubrobacter deserti]MBE2318784.1 cryptochrome/photolyase family protein [Solirubrobacter deserti]MDA0138164.1 cryptochrome/photolyase family protein [Solirubrobacter deserti]
MGHTALILGDQLMRDNPALDGAERVLFVEALAPLRRVRTHRRRAHLVFSAMRHFAAELENAEYVRADSFADALKDRRDVVCAEPNNAGARAALRRLGVRFVASNQFLGGFDEWAHGRKRLLMEDFYRAQRRRLGVLLDADGQPEGERWNYDHENRRPPKAGLLTPEPWRPREDEIDAQVRRDLDALDGVELWGADGPRQVAATPGEARDALDAFVRDRLPEFGPWQDAMVGDDHVVFHSQLSAPLNLGVLEPLRAVRAAEQAYRDGHAPPASVEGFVRQIIGWREYVWGMYWQRRDRGNALGAQRELPAAFWGEPTGWNCLDTVVQGVNEDAYANHIERLMVLSNILLLAGVKPWEAVRWFQGSFIDGAEWVMAPNAAGMALYADGGEMMSKPYAAGGNYINKMSTFCGGCRYEPNVRAGEDACPVTALYWDFMDRHQERLSGNRRMRMPLRTLSRLDDLDAVRERSRAALRELG